MTTVTQLPSSLADTKRKSFDRKIDFKTPKPVPMAERDYGLMRIAADRANTPFPRASVGVDVDTLRARLEEEQQTIDNNLKRVATNSIYNMRSNLHFGNEKAAKSKTRLPPSFGTPHPLKGLALNPKSLKRHLESIDWESVTWPSRWSSIKRLSDIQSYMLEAESARKSIRKYISPRNTQQKKVVTLNSCLRRHSSKKSYDAGGKRAKKVTIVTPWQGAKTDDPDYVHSERSLSFKKRRQLFDKAEFTIARNGKKMSDYFIGGLSSPIAGIDKTVLEHAAKANKEMETFIKKIGFVKSAPNVLAGKLKRTSSLSLAI